MSIQRTGKNAIQYLLVATAAVVVGQGRASADVLYASTGDANRIVSVDTTTGSVNTVFTTPNPPPDGLTVDVAGNRILYLDQGNNAVAGSGGLRAYNLTTGTDTLIAGGLSRPADITVEGPNTVLVSEFNAGRIDRINLTTGAVSLLGSYGGTPNGLTFDASGRLFAVLGTRTGGPTGSFVAQLNPITGAIIAQTAGLNSVDGLTYDRFTGQLFGASTLGSVLYSINPNNLNSVVGIALPGLADGVSSNGRGDLFIGGRPPAGQTGASIFDYNLMTGVITTSATIAGSGSIDLVGAVPEPSTFALVAIGAVACAGRYGLGRRRRRAAV